MYESLVFFVLVAAEGGVWYGRRLLPRSRYIVP